MIEKLDDFIFFIQNSGLMGAFISSLILILESILPIIPLVVFVSINFLILGNILGFFVSWVCTIIGCIISYCIFKKGFGNKFQKFIRHKKLLKKYSKLFKKISTGKLILIIAFPFTPAFIINIAAGLTKMNFKKYFVALLFGKVSLIIYCAYIGLSFVESIHNPLVILKIFIVILIVYGIYLLTKKIFKLDI